jgi:hypothetical protein
MADSANIAGLGSADRRTEILRAKNFAELETSLFNTQDTVQGLVDATVLAYANTNQVTYSATAGTWLQVDFPSFADNVGGFSVDTSGTVTVPTTGFYDLRFRWETVVTSLVVSDEGYGSATNWVIDMNTIVLANGSAGKIRFFTAGQTFQCWVYNRGATNNVTMSAHIFRIR